ncbi:hypothetical protein HAX54_034519 [Datura stramonium]|uniref:Uncharacterized protein n=1 Tax=Datura stramonium TaxID=4076 RepID=A0ABS8VE19_DATST|nr:hypothetical protein [Datura stramonium]
MTMNVEETSKKTSRPQLVVLNKAFKLAEQWVNRPRRLGIGAAVPRQSQTVLSNDPVERKLRAKLDVRKRRKLKSCEVSTISPKDGKADEESDEEESESKTKAFTKKRPLALILNSASEKEEVTSHHVAMNTSRWAKVLTFV